MYACVYVKIEWVMCIRYILYRYNIYIYCIYTNTHYIYLLYRHILERWMYFFNFTGPGWTNPCWIPFGFARGRMSDRDQPFHVKWKFGAIRKSHDLRVLHAGGIFYSGTAVRTAPSPPLGVFLLVTFFEWWVYTMKIWCCRWFSIEMSWRDTDEQTHVRVLICVCMSKAAIWDLDWVVTNLIFWSISSHNHIW